MRFLIDGSNLLGYMGLLGEDNAGISLLARVDRFCRRKRHSATVVFDALPGRNASSQFKFGDRITVRIAPPGEDPDRADSLILTMLGGLRSSDAMRVVTDDNALISGIRSKGFEELRCREFTGMLNQTIRSSSAASEKEAAARGIDNREFLRLWAGDDMSGDAEEP